MADLTFKHLLQVIKSAPRTRYGYYDPYPKVQRFPKYILHIYEGRHEVNINRIDADINIDRMGVVGTPVMKFIFSEQSNSVTLCSIDHGGCVHRQEIHPIIDTELYRMRGWFRTFDDGDGVYSMLNLILTPILLAEMGIVDNSNQDWL